MAELMEVSKNTIHDIETGKKFVRADLLAEFSVVFNIDVYRLFMPKNTTVRDPAKIITRYTEEAKDALENLLDNYITNKL